MKSELADVTGERDRVNQIVAAENNSREFQAWSASITEGIKDSCEKLADARLALGALSVNCARGLERFGSAAPAVLEEQIARFIHTQTQIVGSLERAGLRFTAAYKGLSKTPYKAEGPEVGGRLAVVAVREHLQVVKTR